MSPKIEKTPQEIAAELAERQRVDATLVGVIGRATYEAALLRSGLAEKTVNGKWEELAMHLRVQWLEGAQITLRIIGDAGGAHATARAVLGEAYDPADLETFLTLFGSEGSVTP